MKSKFHIFVILLSFLSTVVQAQTNFTITGRLNTARDGHTATLLPNGLVLVTGGQGNSGFLTSCVLYNPATGTWTTTGSLNTARRGHTATLLPNGLVLVSGGIGNGGILTSCELYNPATGTWTPTGSLNTAREYHTATLLANGLVLVTAGYTNSALASCELYYFGIEEFGSSPTMPTLAVGSTVTARTVNGLVPLNFTNVIGMPFCVLTTTNVALPVASWSALGVPTELSPGQFQFTDSQLPTAPARFYRISSPYGN